MEKYKDVFVRAGKTFLQAFCAVVAISLTSDAAVLGTDIVRIFRAAFIAGVASLFSFGQNALKVSKNG